jgi:transcriptional regulator with XRE-family HTH domain
MTPAELELDAEMLYEAIDRQRRRLRMRRKEVAAELGVAGCTYTLWGNGTKPGSDAVLRACVWLSREITDFAKKDEVA